MGLTTRSISTAQFLQPLARFNPSLLPTNTPTVVLPPPSLSLSYSDRRPTHSSQSLGWVARPSSPRFITRASATNVPENIGEILGDVTIFRASGEPVMFKDLWDQSEGMAVVALLRHFGCPCCWELASTLKEYKDKFESAGVKLIAVGVGTPDKARLLAERLPFPMEYLYADPERKAYDVLGLYYGFRRTFFNPASAKVWSMLEHCRRQPKTILWPPHLMIEVVFCNREECLSSKGSNCYMLGKTKEHVIMPHWTTFSMCAAKFQLHEPLGMWKVYAIGCRLYS